MPFPKPKEVREYQLDTKLRKEFQRFVGVTNSMPWRGIEPIRAVVTGFSWGPDQGPPVLVRVEIYDEALPMFSASPPGNTPTVARDFDDLGLPEEYRLVV